jgi:hypothetical protein
MNETIQDVLLYYRYLHALDIIRTDRYHPASAQHTESAQLERAGLPAIFVRSALQPTCLFVLEDDFWVSAHAL